MTDYESKVHNLYTSVNYMASDKLRLHGMLTWNKAESALDEVIMPDITERLDGELENQDFDFEILGTYSDLDYTLMKFNGGFSYKLSPKMTFTFDGEYADLTDDKGYVFGNESGSFFMIRSGLKLNF